MVDSARPFLVFSSVGASSCHLQWLAGRRNFEVALVDYAGGCAHSADYRLWRREGLKWPNFDFLLEVWPEAAEYAAIAVLDDDLELSGASLSRAFELFAEHELWLAQPALTLDSAYSWAFTLQRPYLRLRYTAFVENGLTILRGSDLGYLREAFRLARSGYGLDWALPQLLAAPREKVAVLDEVGCLHRAHPSQLDLHWDRNEQSRQGDELCRALGVTPLAPAEYGYVLNERGNRWVAEGEPPERVYASAVRFVQWQVRESLARFQEHRHGQSGK